ncbi:MAG: hypothetical protein ACTSQA_04705, partial [Candidatus Heimdallarchaeaceae archaeon]
FWVSSIKPTIGYNLETLGRSLGLPKLTFIGQQIGDELLAEAMKRPELSLSMEDLKKKFKESPSTAAQMAVGRFSGGSMPYMGTSVIGGVVGGLIGGPVGAKVGMFTPIYTLEKSNLYKDLIQDKVDPVVANKAADIFGVISALIEMGIGYTPQGITKAIKSGARKAFKQSWKMFLTKEFPKMITRWQLKTAEEGGEEGLQYLAEKIVRKWIKAPESDIVLQSNAPEAKAGLTIENIEARKRIPKRLHPLMEKVVEFDSAKEFFDKLTSPEGIKIKKETYHQLDIPNLTDSKLPARFSDVEFFYNQAKKAVSEITPEAQKGEVSPKELQPLAKEAITTGKPVFRGTMGLGEINQIPTNWDIMYQKDYGNLWTDTARDAEKYARGFSQVTNKGFVRKPIGNEPFLIEGRKMPDGSVVPIKATNLDTNEVIDFTKPPKISPIAQKEVSEALKPEISPKVEVTPEEHIENTEKEILSTPPPTPEENNIAENYHEPTKATKIGKGIQKAGAEKGIQVGEVAQYQPIKQSEEFQKASEYITKNPEGLKDILLGTKEMPKDINTGSFVNALINHLRESDDSELYNLAANSEVLAKTSEAAQLLGALPEENEFSPLTIIKNIRKSREKIASQHLPISEKKLAQSLDSYIQKSVLQKLEQDSEKYSPLIQAIKRGELKVSELFALGSDERIQLLSKYLGGDAVSANLDFEKKQILKHIDIGVKNWVSKWGHVGRYSPVKIAELNKAKEIWKQKQFARVFNPKSYESFLSQLASKITGRDITPQEAKTIFKLTREVEKLKKHWTKEKGWSSIENKSKYGSTVVLLKKYIDTIESPGAFKDILISRLIKFKTEWQANKAKSIIDLVKDAVTNLSDTSIALVATMDDSFIGMQGIKVLYTNPKVWLKAAFNSGRNFIGTLKHNDMMWDATLADYYSRDNYMNGSYKDARIETRVFERFPSQAPERIPLWGKVFKASEVAFKSSSMEMKMNLYDINAKIMEANGVDMEDKYQRKSLGRVVNSLTGQGEWGQRKGSALRLILWAPRKLKGNIDVLTAHTGQDISTEARRLATHNAIKTIVSIAAILLLAKLFDKDSIEEDPRSSNFGRIMIGPNHDFPVDISGGMLSIATLATRIAIGAYNSLTSSTIANYKSSVTGRTYDTAHAKYGEPNTTDIIVNFLEGKTTPMIHAFMSVLNQEMFGGKRPTVGRLLEATFAPISIQNIRDIKEVEVYNKPTAILSAISDFFGFNSYAPIRSVQFEKPIIKEINRLQDDGYDNVQTSYISGFLQENKLLTTKENKEIFSKLTNLNNRKLGGLLKSDFYAKLSGQEKAKAISRFLNMSRDFVYL